MRLGRHDCGHLMDEDEDELLKKKKKEEQEQESFLRQHLCFRRIRALQRSRQPVKRLTDWRKHGAHYHRKSLRRGKNNSERKAEDKMAATTTRLQHQEHTKPTLQR